jgi:hypothetical protein
MFEMQVTLSFEIFGDWRSPKHFPQKEIESTFQLGDLSGAGIDRMK